MERRKFTNEFKLGAVKLTERGDAPVSHVARDLGLHETVLRRWMEKFGPGKDGSRVTPDEHDELIRLRREIKRLKEERDILKKATAFFARESQ